MKNIHFISITNDQTLYLAKAIKDIEYKVTISDENISDKLKKKLKEFDLSFNDKWFPNKINKNIDAVVLGSNVKEDNSELIKAKSLGIKIFSFEEFVNDFSENKTRVVVAGALGKTSIISIVLHVLKFHNVSVDFIINNKISVSDSLIHLSKENDFIIIEGYENSFSEIDSLPKHEFYNPHLALIPSCFPNCVESKLSLKDYKSQLSLFIDSVVPGGVILYNENNSSQKKIVNGSKNTIRKESYSVPESEVLKGITYLKAVDGNYPLKSYGDFSLINIGGSLWICQLLGIGQSDFYEAIISYNGY